MPRAAKKRLIVGLGVTGMSVARHLVAHGLPYAVTDSRAEPPQAAALAALGNVPSVFGRFEAPIALSEIAEAVISPGVDLRDPFIGTLRAAGIPLVGDIELFARALSRAAPVIGITGSNGKSTVTTLVGAMAKATGRRVAVGGNLGTPALDLLGEQAELYVLELSSFQLELTRSLACATAACLNISPDHIDRHGSLERYAALKLSIYRGATAAVVNADDALAQPVVAAGTETKTFRLGPPAGDEYGLFEESGARWLCHGREKILPLAALRIYGLHNAANALAALALADAIGLPRAASVKALREFGGLPHRCQWLAEIAHVNYYNDSKGTNVGATLAALSGLPAPIVLLAGGQAKGADFSPWAPVLKEKARALVLFGEDAPSIAHAVGDSVPRYHVGSMHEAVQQAAAVARPGDAVLLSPGCASFDMFKDYADRGAQFAAEVARLSTPLVREQRA